MRTRRIVVLLAALSIAATGLVACVPSGGGPVSQNLPIRAAFYYPWYGEAWTQQGINPYTNYTPTRGFYDTNPVVAAHVQDMLYAGLTAGIASWWGQGTKTDQRMPNLLAATAGTKFQWAPYYEPEGVGDPTPAVIKSDLDYLASKYANDPGFLHVNGKPVIFAFAQGSDGCAMADRWHNADPNHAWYVDLKVFPGYKTCANQPDSWHQYGPSSPTDNQPGFSYSVSPGFWKVGETPRLVRDPARFTANVQSMVASGAPWQLTSTFNEMGEGTSIESVNGCSKTAPAGSPGCGGWASSSGRGQYLDILHSILGGTSSTTTTATSTSSTTAPTSTSTTSSTSPSSTTTVSSSTTSTSSSTSTTSTTVPTSSSVCGNPGSPKARQKVVVFAFENRTWSDVGGTQFQSVPYFHGLATTGKCPTFANYTEPDTGQNSATQYVGQWAGSTANTVRNDCQPSASCQSTQDNVGRQARTAGLTVRSYVEGATSACSASGNAAKHVPALYFRAAQDASHCAAEVLPYSAFNPNALADFSFITPTLCHDGHDCSNATVSTWAAANVQPVLNSAAYKAGNVTVEIWFDEDRPVPNMFIGTHAIPGVKSTPIDYGSTLRAWESLLGLPFIAHAATATDLRPLAGI